MSISDRIRVKDVRLLSDHYGTLKTTTLDWRRADESGLVFSVMGA